MIGAQHEELPKDFWSAPDGPWQYQGSWAELVPLTPTLIERLSPIKVDHIKPSWREPLIYFLNLEDDDELLLCFNSGDGLDPEDVIAHIRETQLDSGENRSSYGMWNQQYQMFIGFVWITLFPEEKRAEVQLMITWRNKSGLETAPTRISSEKEHYL